MVMQLFIQVKRGLLLLFHGFFSPAMLFIYLKMTDFGTVGELRFDKSTVLIFVMIFIASFVSLYVGMYDSYEDGIGFGSFHEMFVKSLFGVYMFYYAMWFGFYITLGSFLKTIKSVLIGGNP